MRKLMWPTIAWQSHAQSTAWSLDAGHMPFPHLKGSSMQQDARQEKPFRIRHGPHQQCVFGLDSVLIMMCDHCGLTAPWHRGRIRPWSLLPPSSPDLWLLSRTNQGPLFHSGTNVSWPASRQHRPGRLHHRPDNLCAASSRKASTDRQAFPPEVLSSSCEDLPSAEGLVQDLWPG